MSTSAFNYSATPYASIGTPAADTLTLTGQEKKDAKLGRATAGGAGVGALTGASTAAALGAGLTGAAASGAAMGALAGPLGLALGAGIGLGVGALKARHGAKEQALNQKAGKIAAQKAAFNASEMQALESAQAVKAARTRLNANPAAPDYMAMSAAPAPAPGATQYDAWNARTFGHG
ncbi:MAG: hypothetical protein GY913_21435 [Proteobacteria bacterium]|nr:hypothetical protein [Actinomycetes bacterium]MCP4919472.1 hypothetical protein [Pseudomonadota bacterium]